MTMTLKIDDKYLPKLESFIASLPKGAVEMRGSLDEEIMERVEQYENGQMKTTPFTDGLHTIKERLLSQR